MIIELLQNIKTKTFISFPETHKKLLQRQFWTCGLQTMHKLSIKNRPIFYDKGAIGLS